MESQLVNRDAQTIWHPYTQALTSKPPIPILKGEGAYLFGYDGTAYFDAVSSWWVNLHGHAHPYIASKIASQAYQLEQVMFSDCTHAGAVEISERLLALLKMGSGRAFFSENGSTAVETALKMALQYWHNQSIPRTKIVCFEKGYHGDTFGAMSLARKGLFNSPFWPFLFEIETISPPFDENEEISLKQLSTLLKKGDVACFIFEPLIQGVAGMRTHSAAGLNALIQACKEYDVLTIADEVMTGFGRTGPLFACDLLKAKPDIYCFSKGLTGGFLPLGVTICEEKIYQAFLSEQRIKAFLHGHSYCANPLACAAALANLDLLNQECAERRMKIQKAHVQFCSYWSNHPHLTRCEALGTILIVEYKDHIQNSYFSALRDHLLHIFLQNHILIRPLGNVLYLMPPYCTPESTLEKAYKCIEYTIERPLWNV